MNNRHCRTDSSSVARNVRPRGALYLRGDLRICDLAGGQADSCFFS